MLILPQPGEVEEASVPVGANCRICSVPDCKARREVSIMADGF